MDKKINRPDYEIVKQFEQYSTTNVSDALDKLGLKSGIDGILPQPGMKKLVGTAITMKVTAAGESKPTSHMGADPLRVAGKGDVIVIDNGGRRFENCWGEILTYAAIQKGIRGTIIDGVFRDVDIIQELEYPVYARGLTPTTARGRTIQQDYNCIIRLGHVQVRPGDIVMGDQSGVVVIPSEKAEEVLKITKDIYEREQSIIEQIKKGVPFEEVDKKSGYDKMLEKKE